MLLSDLNVLVRFSASVIQIEGRRVISAQKNGVTFITKAKNPLYCTGEMYIISDRSRTVQIKFSSVYGSGQGAVNKGGEFYRI
jgi:hypothetical protein